jgi:hypothetical protein
MTDILGPSTTALNSVTVRPADTRTLGPTDTWVKSCTSSSAGDGTRITDAFLNGLIGALRGIVRRNGNLAGGGPVVAEDNSDLMLAKSVDMRIQRNRLCAFADVGAINAMVTSGDVYPPELVDGMELLIFPENTSTSSCTISHGGFVRPIVVGELPTIGGEIKKHLWTQLCYTSSRDAWQIVNTNQAKIRILSSKTFYVRSDGDDANDGLTNTAGGAFETIQGAFDAISTRYEAGGGTITIKIGLAGSYVGAHIHDYSGPIILDGDVASPTSYTITSNPVTGYVIQNAISSLLVKNCVLNYTYSGSPFSQEATVYSINGGICVVENVTYNCSSTRTSLYENLANGSGSQVVFNPVSPISITGAGARAAFALVGLGALITTKGTVVTTFQSTGTIAYGQAFAVAATLGNIAFVSSDFSAVTATGKRYDVTKNAVIDTGTGNVNYLPGSLAGTDDGFGAYF